MGAVENNLVVPVQSIASAGDEPRVLCIIYNMLSATDDGRGKRTFSTNLPMSVPCQTLINDIKSKFDNLPADVVIVYERPVEGEVTTSVTINDCPEKSLGEVCLHCGDRGRNSFFIYGSDTKVSSQNENWDVPSVKPRTERSNAIYDSTDLYATGRGLLGEASTISAEIGCSNKDNYNACSASASSSSGLGSFSLGTLPKSDTGYVGLVNQAMTCYLNSLLQTLYMTPEFRNAVYRWKFDGKDAEASRSIPYQLQRLFLQLQTSAKRAIETTDITRSFGWDSSEAWHQHDIQELCRVMFDALERTWRSTDQANLINELYQGRMKDYVKCLRCGSVNARPDTYLDLPLVIRPHGSEVGYGSVELALKAFEEPEILDGNNQYYCEKCGQHCDAHKGLRVVSFPYILTLHLKRFGFDHFTYQRFKLNDRMTFPEVLVLERSVDEGVDEDAKLEKAEADADAGVGTEATPEDEAAQKMPQGQEAADDEGIDVDESASYSATGIEHPASPASHAQVTYQYQLFSIMVHSGSAAGGHYYAYIRSFKDDQWYSFNDQHVFRINEEDIERTFGGSSISSSSYSTYSSSTNAYMLQYRLVDLKRNRGFMEEADFPSYLRGELLNIQRQEKQEMLQQELDRNTCKIKLFYFDGFQQKFTEHKLEVHRSKTLAEATEVAWRQLELADVLALDCVRLVKFDSTQDYIEHSFEGEEQQEMGSVLGAVKSSYHFDLMLETKRPDEEFHMHFLGGVMTQIHLVDLKDQTIHDSKLLRVQPSATVGEFKELVNTTFGLCLDSMTVVLDRGFADFFPLFKSKRTLSEEGFNKVNRVFVECSGVEAYDGCFTGTRFYQILDRFANTISLTISLPSVAEISRMDTSLLRKYFSNNQPQSPSVPSNDHLPGNVTTNHDEEKSTDEGIEAEGELEAPNDGPVMAQAQSETDLNSSGVGTAEGTNDWCSSIASSEAVHDANEQYSRCDNEVQSAVDSESCLGTVEALGKTDISSDLGIDKVPRESGISSRFSNDEGLGDGDVCSSAGTVEVPVDQGLCLSLATSKLSDLPTICGVSAAPDEYTCPDLGTNDEVQNETDPYSVASDALIENDPSPEISESTCETDVIGEPETPKSSNGDYWTANEGGHLSDNEEQTEFSNNPTPLTSPRVSSNGSNSPYLENEKEMVCPKESEENWDLDETTATAGNQCESNYSYFRVDRDVNGLFEHTLTIQVDRRMTVGRLKAHLEPYMGTSSDFFRVFRVSATSPDMEMTKIYEQLVVLNSGSKLAVKLGRALRPGEYKLSVYQLLIHEVEPIKFGVEVIVPKAITLCDLKRIIANALYMEFGTKVQVERCRLRKRSWKNPAGIFTNDHMLEDLFKESTTNIDILLEVLDEGPDRMEMEETTLLQIYLRRWRPSIYQLEPLQELIVSDWTLDNIRREISKMSGIDEENVCVAKARVHFPCNLPVLEVERDLLWNPVVTDISVFPMSVADDGAVLIYKDKTEPVAELTEDQKIDVQQKENTRLQKPPTKLLGKTERALKIYTAPDHHDDLRASSRPV